MPLSTSRMFADRFRPLRLAGSIQRRDYRPFGVGHVAGITNAVPYSGMPVIGFPHGALPSRSGASNGIANDSADSNSFRIGAAIQTDAAYIW
jgi:hypothetical protein